MTDLDLTTLPPKLLAQLSKTTQGQDRCTKENRIIRALKHLGGAGTKDEIIIAVYNDGFIYSSLGAFTSVLRSQITKGLVHRAGKKNKQVYYKLSEIE